MFRRSTLLFLTALTCSCSTPRPQLQQCVQQAIPQQAFQPPKAQSSVRATLAPNSTKSAETATPK